MNNIQAKKIVTLLAQKWKIKNKKFFFELVEFLDKNVNKKYSFYNGFEFSWIEKEPKIRLLHLDFWKTNLSRSSIEKILKKRTKSIVSIFNKFTKQFNCSYKLSLLKKFLKFNKAINRWPVQFGFEYQKKMKPKLKVYLSVNGDRFPMRTFCNEFNLNYKLLNRKFNDKKFDAIAIDFLPNNDYCFKFYPIKNKNEGFLFRITKNSETISVKKWKRFPEGLSIKDKRVINFIKLPKFLYKIIKKNNLKVHYLCEENGKRSIYFR
jgi:hypothetical protein